MTYSIAWQAGPSAQIELFSADAKAETDSFRFKYSPSMRKTLRPPMTGLDLGERALLPVREILDELIGLIDTRSRLPVPPPPGSPPANKVFDSAYQAGNMLMELILPDDARADLAGSENMFLEIGLDEKLLEYPWELMFEDTTGFLCCRHSIGRFVNVSTTTPLRSTANARFRDGPLSILLISVPNPMPRVGKPPFAPLPGARMETDAIANTVSIPGVELTTLTGSAATWMAVVNALKGPKRFHIVHFNGHAYFDEANPHYSSLVLYDKDIEAGPIYKYFRNKPPVLFFMNGCETAMAHGARPWKNRYDIFGLARAFLDTGAFLLGTRG
jgi:CHAT domain-containing protein